MNNEYNNLDSEYNGNDDNDFAAASSYPNGNNDFAEIQPYQPYAITRNCASDYLANELELFKGTLRQWSTKDRKIYSATGVTAPVLEPGVYCIKHNPAIGIYFEKIDIKKEGLLKFPDSVSDKVFEQIQNFWDRKNLYQLYDLAYKRGIMLMGNPGSGKSSLIQMLTHDVIARNGIVINFGVPQIFIDGMRQLRQIQPHTPVIVIMEDIDSSLETYGATEILNILDGIERIDGVVFVATTNYPEKLGGRIINRPSRFDKRYTIDAPNIASRKLYLDYLSKGNSIHGADFDKWATDTEGFSIAHLKELFSDVVIFGTPYEEALVTLSNMSEIIKISTDGFKSKKIGFSGGTRD